MSRPPVGFEVALEDLTPEERASLVAAIYDARGWESEGVGTVVSVRPPVDGDGPRRVAPPGVATTEGVATLSSDDVREMLRYAVAPDDRTRLCRRFFDRSPDAVGVTGTHAGTPDDGRRSADDTEVQPTSSVESTESADGGVTDDAPDRPAGDPGAAADGAPDDDESGGRRTPAAPPVRAAVVAVLACAVVAAALFATWPVVPVEDATGSPSAAETPSVGNGSENVGTPLADDEAAGGGSAADDEWVEDSTSGRQVVLEESYPPGVGTDGVENVSALAAAHRSTLSNRSYRLSVTNRESVDGQRTGVAWERAVVEAPARHRSRVRVAGTFRWPPTGVANASTYANGTTRIVRVGANTDADGNVRFESPAVENRSVAGPSHRVVGPAPDTDPFAVRTASLLGRALSETDTAVTGTFERGGTTYFWIEIRSPSAASAVDEGSLLVDERGLVHELRYARTVISLDSTPVTRTVTVRVTPGNVTLVSPPWYRPEDAADRHRSLALADPDSTFESRHARLTVFVRRRW